jgi:hypothetical protein
MWVIPGVGFSRVIVAIIHLTYLGLVWVVAHFQLDFLRLRHQEHSFYLLPLPLLTLTHF